jgi:hypothetical protein
METVTIRKAIMIFIAWSLLILRFTRAVAASAITHHGCAYNAFMKAIPKMFRTQEEQAADQYDCDSFHFWYKDNKSGARLFRI